MCAYVSAKCICAHVNAPYLYFVHLRDLIFYLSSLKHKKKANDNTNFIRNKYSETSYVETLNIEIGKAPKHSSYERIVWLYSIFKRQSGSEWERKRNETK